MRLLITSTVLLFVPCFLFSQVYFCQYNKGLVFCGPENILAMSQSTKEDCISSIQDEMTWLSQELDLIDSLQQAPKLKRVDKKRLQNLKSQVHLLDIDIKYLKELLSTWSRFDIQQYDDLSNDFCFYNESDQLAAVEINTSQHLDGDVIEFVDLTAEVYDSPQWIKKKADANCLSPNPDDCYVWCLETTRKYFRDMVGNEIDLSQVNEVLDFDYQSTNQRMELAYPPKSNEDDLYLIAKSEDVQVPLARLVSCIE